ncbi:hypothetical protein SAMN05421866_1830 [Chryseobacterium oranimense]|uniref:Uncharacterized protein n=1 Tax=Chryseobacterium oranimense TaxID=421058 RepID=A0A1M5PIE7_9FLAO|nr:hypothetical protein [Chryseobacterium oranimense]SHH01574.1 hypothetical protein SAMN05421866_1830 [Chryseobacterium oranimense]
MKKLYFLIFGLFQILSYSQTQDLTTLAAGDHVGMNALFDDKDNLYGYVSLYSYGKTGDKTKKFEYVILDKNLNPVANKEFEGDITAASYLGYVDFKGQIILKPSMMDYSLVKSREIFTPVSMVIDPKTNTIKRKVYYDYLEDGTFKEINEPKNWKAQRKENRDEKKEKGYNYVSAVGEVKEGGYFAIEYKDYGKYINSNSIIKFDDNKKELWRYKYNTDGNKKVFTTLSILERDENYMYCIMKKVNDGQNAFSLLVIDMKTGKEASNKPIEGTLTDNTLDNIDSYGRLDNDKTFDDKVVLLGRNLDKFETIGYARMMVNKADFTVDTRWINFVPDLKTFLPKINTSGIVENGYMLQTKDMYFMNDGSVGILTEKYKPEGQYSAPKTTDLVYIYTDKDFKIKNVQVFEKEKTKWVNSDYLFSQYLNGGKDVVFFYRDYQKDEVTRQKKWNLFINTVIDGKFKQEIIPISEKDNYAVIPYVGKEGYILLREYNEKEKFNKIRLEKLNY